MDTAPPPKRTDYILVKIDNVVRENIFDFALTNFLQMPLILLLCNQLNIFPTLKIIYPLIHQIWTNVALHDSNSRDRRGAMSTFAHPPL